ncbi:MAG: four helix bundle protein [Acidobacteriota bacterium]
MKRKPAKTFEDLVVWHKAHHFALSVYRETVCFPKFELYELRSQLRRAAISIPANIAEGFKKRGKGDKARFMNIAQGSLEETRYYLILARDLGYLKNEGLQRQLEEVSRLLEAYSHTIMDSRSKPNTSGF